MRSTIYNITGNNIVCQHLYESSVCITVRIRNLFIRKRLVIIDKGISQLLIEVIVKKPMNGDELDGGF